MQQPKTPFRTHKHKVNPDHFSQNQVSTAVIVVTKTWRTLDLCTISTIGSTTRGEYYMPAQKRPVALCGAVTGASIRHKNDAKVTICKSRHLIDSDMLVQLIMTRYINDTIHSNCKNKATKSFKLPLQPSSTNLKGKVELYLSFLL